MPKIINIEPTPNPNALKFVVREPLLENRARSFQDFASAVGDPLGSAIFALGSVTSVFYMDKFVTVNKLQSATWAELIDPICEVIEECRIDNEATNVEDVGPSEADEKFGKIMEIVNNRIRPGLAGDGGGLEVISFDGKTLTIAYQGACGSCPAAGTGTLQFIEGLLRHEVDPSIRVSMS
ncbi:MAG: NifU family protein [Holophagaceae bacterium]|nr:NifU family protein [Holophagaceae bacterium]